MEYPHKIIHKTTLALEKQTNPFLRCNELSIKKRLHKKESTKALDIFKELRKRKDNFHK